jgi:hypothetical protein
MGARHNPLGLVCRVSNYHHQRWPWRISKHGLPLGARATLIPARSPGQRRSLEGSTGTQITHELVRGGGKARGFYGTIYRTDRRLLRIGKSEGVLSTGVQGDCAVSWQCKSRPWVSFRPVEPGHARMAESRCPEVLSSLFQPFTLATQQRFAYARFGSIHAPCGAKSIKDVDPSIPSKVK